MTTQTFLHDDDLEFLKEESNEHLQLLVEYIIGPDDNRRLTETLSNRPGFSNDYRQCLEIIIDELQLYGGNSIANFLRGGQGVPYREILCDVCDRLKVNYNKKQSIREIEAALMQKIFTNSVENMSEEEVAGVAEELGRQGSQKMTKAALLAAVQVAIKMGGFKSYIITLKIANAIASAVAKQLLGQSIRFGINRGLTKSLSVLAGPIGWTLTAVWALYDLAGTAYRVTIPACIHIAWMRVFHESKQQMVECRNGHANGMEAKFCSECGQSLSEEENS